MTESRRAATSTNVLWPLWVILFCCAVVEAALFTADLGLWSSGGIRGWVYENAAFWVGHTRDWRPNYALQPYAMFFTYAFLHGGPVHLIVNMLALYSLGRVVIVAIGPWRFLLLYVVSALGGGVGFAQLSNGVQPMVGASGAIFGLIGAVIAWGNLGIRSAKQRFWNVFQQVTVLIIFNVVLFLATNGQLAWETHLGGFIAGVVFGLYFAGKARS